MSEITGRLLRERDKHLGHKQDLVITRQKGQIEELKKRLFEVQHERDQIAESLNDLSVKHRKLSDESAEWGSSKHCVELELEQLHQRYNDLLETFQRASERYKRDFEKWRRFKTWIFGEQTSLTVAEKKKMVAEKRKLLTKLGITASDLDQEEASPGKVLAANSSDIESSPAKRSCSTTEDDDSQANPIVTPRVPLAMVPAYTQTPSSRINSLPTPVTIPARRKGSEAALTTSNEPPAKHRRLNSDDAIQIKQEPEADIDFAEVKENVNPSAPLLKKPGQTVDSRAGSTSTSSTVATKKRSAAVSVDDDVFTKPSTSSTKYTKPTDATFVGPPASTSSSKPGEKRKQLPFEAYAKYKGRGRYAAHEEEDGDPDYNKPITSLFGIDPSKNDGADYQYDEVVRNKNERKKMHGGDCLCCQDYYKAMGPMPPRLQPPVWRSPGSTPAHLFTNANASGSSSSPTRSGSESTPVTPTKSKSKAKSSRSSKPSRATISAHKNQISRHRHHWAPTTTPPKYWSIGFPDTQEVERINEAAREIHKRKVDGIRKEVKDGGRWMRK